MELPLKKLVTTTGQHIIYPVSHINAYHSDLKCWIHGVFHNVATKYLKHYLGRRQTLMESKL